MESTRAQVQVTSSRQVGGRVVLLGLLASFILVGGPVSATADLPARADLASARPSATNHHGQPEVRPEHVEPRADGAIDTFEDDDCGHGEADPSCLQDTESFAAAGSRIARLTGDALARPYLARAPPSA